VNIPIRNFTSGDSVRPAGAAAEKANGFFDDSILTLIVFEKEKMSSPLLLKFYRRPALSSSALARILAQLNSPLNRLGGCLSRVESEYVYYVEVSEPLTESQVTALVWLLSETFEPENFSLKSFLVSDGESGGEARLDSTPTIVEVGPRPSFTSAFSTNAVAVCKSCGVPALRIERFRRFRLFCTLGGREEGDEEDAPSHIADEFAAVAHDRMTEYRVKAPISSFKIDLSPEPVRVVPLLSGGKPVLEEMNKTMGLSLDARDIDYILALFRDELKRDPTDVELFDFSQSNSEHSRHWFFRGILDIDGERIPYTLMDLVKSTLDAKPHNSVIAFADNSSAIKGFPTKLLIPSLPGHPSSLAITSIDRHLLLTAETHNFPTGIAPFPGAETGTGGRIRDSHATGRGSYPIAASAGYCVGNLRLPGYPLPWENSSFSYPDNMASPLQIEIDASNGASDYGNKFGEPVVLGFTRSFGLEIANGERREYIKPIMFTAGIGAIDDNHLIKGDAKENMVVVKLGGPAYRIGMGGSAASSMLQGDNKADLDFNAVQRGDAQMEHKVNRVIRACCELGTANPIVSIHDQGAGGNCNVLKEIISPAGGRIDIRKVISGDASLSVLELWGAEYQESDALLISADSTAMFSAICERERVPVAYVGVVTGDGDVRLEDSAAPIGSPLPVNLPLEKVLGKMPPKIFVDNRASPPSVSSSALTALGNITAADALERVLRLISVGSKRFLTNKVDRAVTGLIIQQQCVGPLHTPLADFAVVATSYFDKVGIASSIGEQPVKGLLNPSAMARLAVSEAITNMVGVRISSLSDAKCSANWMWAAKLPNEGAALFDAAKSMADFMIAVGVAIDGGKDSLSMAAKTPEGKTVKAPGTLVISLYAPCPDVENKRTPDIKHPGSSSLVLIRPISSKTPTTLPLRLGGSAFLQVYGHIGNGSLHEAVPDCESPDLLVSAFEVTQSLLGEKNAVLSVHDVSDGGLITTVLEMAFAGNCGIDVCLPGSVSELLPALFAEEVGFVLEVPNGQVETVVNAYSDKGVFAMCLGTTLDTSDVKVRVGSKSSSVDVLSTDMRDLRDVWESTSFELEKRQSSSLCVAQEQKGMRTRKTPPFSLSFSPRKPNEAILLRSPASKPRLAVLREEGSNGDREMSAAFFSVGFDVHDITMSDLISGRTVIDSSFRGIAFPGGFSYADVLDSAKGWAGTVRYNNRVLEQLKAFYSRGDTFSIGVCNGCQLLSLLGWVPFGPDALPPTEQPRFIHNASGRFESRYVSVRITESPSIMLKGMAGSTLGIQVQHGEGRLHFPAPLVREAVECEKLAPLRYVDDEGNDTEIYPFNPNGSGGGIAALCTRDGRHLAMMPHPERTFQKRQLPFLHRHAAEGPEAIEDSPWIKLFANAFAWVTGEEE
jgi:phosphoribosylformylglycinamidine synthase